jgi:membrane protein YdbS with pleckstrin-like domain
MTDETQFRARFHPRLPLYLVLVPALVMLVTVVGIPLLLLWLPLGAIWARRFVDRLTCRVTEDTLEIGKGVLFRKELTIPLDRIQEISLREGPLQRYLGISSLRFETAGAGSSQQAADLNLPGILHARQFRSNVLAQRDARRVGAKYGRRTTDAAPGAGAGGVTVEATAAGAPGGGPSGEEALALLREIRDSLQRIERRESGMGV